MTDDEIRIAVAEACPQIAEIDKDNGGAFWRKPDPFVIFDPLTDLNAMHEAEKVLEIGFDGSQTDDYQQTLYSIVNSGRDFVEDFCNGADVAFLQKLIAATARQRAEAFLRTIGKWKARGEK
jgi:hypothetical protein